MVSPEQISLFAQARRGIDHDVWDGIVNLFDKSDKAVDARLISEATEGLLNKDAGWLLTQALGNAVGLKSNEVAVALKTIDYLIQQSPVPLEIIWTGPANNRFPVRRIDQVIYDLVTSAKRRIVLVTFAAHRVHHLTNHLAVAVKRGVQLTLIVESEEESEGQLSIDAIHAFKYILGAGTHIYCWPAEKRERNAAGRPGKLHVKCALIDDVALIGSANLTDDAFNRNMELGMLIREKETVESLAEHFRELIRNGILVEVKQ